MTHRFKVSVNESTLVDISQSREDLSEEGTGLFLSQSLLCHNVVKQLTTWTELEERTRCTVEPLNYGSLAHYREVVLPSDVGFYRNVWALL